MKNQALFSSKDKSKKLKCRLLQFLFGTSRVKFRNKFTDMLHYFVIKDYYNDKTFLINLLAVGSGN